MVELYIDLLLTSTATRGHQQLPKWHQQHGTMTTFATRCATDKYVMVLCSGSL